ncbi:hypothetical protein [Aliivibrio fischeri]|uniref:hypothetical protein n=1 Tax=Aliivibrio fischeri TaxID=668 RepID=UPI0012DAE133|nr:hypothetical protein [Aliivibrio fischeri]MUK65672.1 hypothetical protein [Aliivibrio fischeri]
MDNKKKQIMYIVNDDPYYTSYWIIILLKVLKNENGKFFTDYKKIPFLISILNNDDLMHLFENTDSFSNSIENRDLLFKSYKFGISKRSSFLHLLLTLEKKSFVTLKRSNKYFTLDVSLNKEKIKDDFFDKGLFCEEYKNTLAFKNVIKRLSSLKLSTFIENTYNKNGVKTWQI